MTSGPKIPMLPSELPQQRIHEVVELPVRPEPFDSKVGLWDYSSDMVPKHRPRNPIYLCQVEWAWTPMHNRVAAYHLHRGRTHWSLWWSTGLVRLAFVQHHRERRAPVAAA